MTASVVSVVVMLNACWLGRTGGCDRGKIVHDHMIFRQKTGDDMDKNIKDIPVLRPEFGESECPPA